MCLLREGFLAVVCTGSRSEVFQLAQMSILAGVMISLPPPPNCLRLAAMHITFINTGYSRQTFSQRASHTLKKDGRKEITAEDTNNVYRQ